ncbi:MAG TPA: hypothetical protein VJI33_02800 [Candidatus Paceibacterota bacterium]
MNPENLVKAAFDGLLTLVTFLEDHQDVVDVDEYIDGQNYKSDLKRCTLIVERHIKSFRSKIKRYSR